ncbi:MAG: Ig-like domain-containing protein [Anaerolineales bacterium]
MVDLRERRGLLRTLLAPVGVLAALLVIYWVAAPRLVSLSPAPDEIGVAPDQPIELHFNRAMDAASVQSRFTVNPNVAGHWRWQDDTARYEPVGTWPEGGTVAVNLAPGARSSLFLPMLGGQAWTFEIIKPRIAYLASSRGRSVLMGRALDGAEPQPLIGASTDVEAYDFGTDGSLATIERIAEGDSIVRWRPGLDEAPVDLHRCPSTLQCSAVAVSPSASWVAWQQRPTQRSETGIVNLGPGSIWVATTSMETPAQPLTSSLSNLLSPTWPGSEILAVLDIDGEALHLFQDEADRWLEATDPIPHPLGEQWTWSPDGRFVVLPEVVFTPVDPTAAGQVGFFSHLYRVEVASGLRTDLSRVEAGMVEDASPAYSPDGLTIAFARKSLVLDQWTFGRQIWVMRADGSGSRQLTEVGNRNHAHLRWSPDGKRLAYVLFDATNPNRPSEVWWLDVASGETSELVAGGFEPEWIP